MQKSRSGEPFPIVLLTGEQHQILHLVRAKGAGGVSGETRRLIDESIQRRGNSPQGVQEEIRLLERTLLELVDEVEAIRALCRSPRT